MSEGETDKLLCRQTKLVCVCARVQNVLGASIKFNDRMNSISVQYNTNSPLQGSIQQLLLKADPTAPDDQCEEDDPYVSLHENTRNWEKFSSSNVSKTLQTWNYGSLCW